MGPMVASTSAFISTTDIRMPGTLWTIWFVSPWPMNPAPIMPTRIGLPCSSLAFRALSTRIMIASRSHPLPHLSLDLRQVLPGGVLRRDDGDRQRPLQPQARIEWRKPAFAAGRVGFAHLVARLGRVFQGLIPVREAFGHVQGPVPVGAQLQGDVLQERRALGPQVHDDVEDRPAGGADQLRLGVRRILEVHASQRALPLVERDVRLRNHGLEAVFGELPLTEGAGEKAALVLAPFHVDDEGTLQPGFGEDHGLFPAGKRPARETNRLTPPLAPRASASRARLALALGA